MTRRAVLRLSDAGAEELAALAAGEYRLYLAPDGFGGGEGSVPTDLSVTRDATKVVIASSSGADATVPGATDTDAGAMTAAHAAALGAVAAAVAGLAQVALSGSAADLTGTLPAARIASGSLPFGKMSGQLDDAQIPSTIARDTEVAAAVAALVDSAPGTLDTLGELATALQAGDSAAAALTTLVGGKADATALAALASLLSITTGGLLTTGEETLHRDLVMSQAITCTSGAIRLRYFTARKTETISQIRVWSGNVAAAATPTLAKVAIFSVAANGDLTRVAVSASVHATLFVATTSQYTVPLVSSFAKVAGQRYAYGILFVTAATAPNTSGIAGAGAAAPFLADPAICGSIGSQTDMQASYTAAQVAAATLSPYAVLLP